MGGLAYNVMFFKQQHLITGGGNIPSGYRTRRADSYYSYVKIQDCLSV